MKNPITKFTILYRSIIFNFKVLPTKEALKLPILVYSPVEISGKVRKGSIVIESKKITRGMIKLGYSKGSFNIGRSSSYLRINEGGILKFKGSALFCSGFGISIANGAEIIIGDNEFFNANLILSAENSIVIGNRCSFGWDVVVIDADGHTIKDITDEGCNLYSKKSVTIGDSVWISSSATILKGVNIGKGSIIPFGSIITKSTPKDYIMWGGSPNRTLKENVCRTDLI